MLQPSAGSNWTNVSGTAAGTTTIATGNPVLDAVVIPASKTGTVTIYDSASGTASKSIEIVNDTVDFPTVIPLGIQMRYGIVAAVGGTASMTLVWH